MREDENLLGQSSTNFCNMVPRLPIIEINEGSSLPSLIDRCMKRDPSSEQQHEAIVPKTSRKVFPL